MTAKEYLWRVRDAERELKQLEQAYARAREGYAQRLSAKWDELINLRETAKKLIDTLKDGRYREVLTLRYLDGQSWEQVAVTMGYTYRGVIGLHGKALKVFGEINCS